MDRKQHLAPWTCLNLETGKTTPRSDNPDIDGLREIIAGQNRTIHRLKDCLGTLVKTIEDGDLTTIELDEARHLLGWRKPPTLKELAARGNQRGSILPEILMVFFVLFAVATCGAHYAKKADLAVERWEQETMRTIGVRR